MSVNTITIEGRVVPKPNYEYDIKKLVNAYKSAAIKIHNTLKRTDLTTLDHARAQRQLQEIIKILEELDATSREWVEENLPKAARQGVATSLVALGAAKTYTEALEKATFNHINRELVRVAVADTQEDLLAVTQNVRRRVRNAVREVTAEVIRANYASGIHGRQTLNREILSQLRSKLGKSLETGIVDAAGRRWKPHVYVDTVVRTKLMETHSEAVTNEALARGVGLGIISSHGATDACRFHEGRIVKLSDEVEGNYPTRDELKATNQIFHPNCRHFIIPIRDIRRLPVSVRRKAEEQKIRGDKALATGKRNPSEKEVDKN